MRRLHDRLYWYHSSWYWDGPAADKLTKVPLACEFKCTVLLGPLRSKFGLVFHRHTTREELYFGYMT
eukprot:9100943-Pyramimonas_sp.AAC.1